MMDDVDDLIDTLENPRHRKILINYRRHGLLEVSGRYEELLAPNMTVPHPHYRLFEGGQGDHSRRDGHGSRLLSAARCDGHARDVDG